jgi:TonB family protein
MKKVFLIILLIISYGVISANNTSGDSINIKEVEIFERVEVMPSFPVGTQSLQKFLLQNIKYPKYARENTLEGIVIVKFYIDKTGAIREPIILNKVDSSLEKEALRVIGLMPKWEPGLLRGKAVNCYFVLPITFKLS